MIDWLRRALLALLLLTSLFGVPAPAHGGQKVQTTGIYSNLQYNEEGGDLLGYEVFIVFGGDKHYAVVQIAEGLPAPPVVVELEVSKSRIAFALPDGGTFTGTLGRKGLSGTFRFAPGGVEKVFLRRGKSHWQ